jgi:hypothetical protein
MRPRSQVLRIARTKEGTITTDGNPSDDAGNGGDGSEGGSNRFAEFWRELPDVLKALAALIGAVATLVGALAAANLIGSSGSNDDSATPSPTATATLAATPTPTASITPTASPTATPTEVSTPATETPTPQPVTYEALAPISLDNRPEAIVSAFGSVWIASRQEVTRIDARSYQTQAQIPILLLANAIAADSSSVWVAASNDERLLSINPSTNREETFDLGRKPTLFDIAAGGGVVWITDLLSPELLTFDTQARTVGDALPLFIDTGAIFSGGTWRIAYDSAEGAWVTAGTSGQVFRIEPAARRGTQVVGLDGEIPYNIAIGLGKIWVQLRGSASLLVIDPADGSSDIVPIDAPEGTRIEDISVAPDAIWILQSRGGGNGLASRLDPQTLRVQDSVTLPPVSDGSSIIVVGDEVWVSHRIEQLISILVPDS